MLEKLNVNGVVITETTADGTTTTLKIDSVSFENEATADEATALLNGLVDVFKILNQIEKQAETTAQKLNKIQLSSDVTKLTTD